MNTKILVTGLTLTVELGPKGWPNFRNFSLNSTDATSKPKACFLATSS